MSADLCIHVMTAEMTEDHLAEFFCNTLGSRWFDMNRRSDINGKAWELVSNSPQVHGGEVSWLKAALLEDNATFIPDAVDAVNDAIGEDLPVIDDVLIAKIKEGMAKGNTTSYQVSGTDPIIEFLEEHRGSRAFTVSW